MSSRAIARERKETFAMPEPFLLIPESLGELSDQLGSMILTAPSFNSRVEPDSNIDTVFEELNRGIEYLCPKFGSAGCEEMSRMSGEARSLFESGKVLEGNHMLKAMIEFIRQKKWK